MVKSRPDFLAEQALMERGILRIAGVDEAGRGPLAGPVTAAAVILDPAHVPDGLNDSKTLSAKQRMRLYEVILGTAEVGIGQASVAEIDALNILQAAHQAMRRAIEALPVAPDHVLIDGNIVPRDLANRATGLVGGDARSLSIAAASIMAKETRDRIMVDLAQQFPGYGWETNKGYPTEAHKAALLRNGVTPHHRRSFRPVHNILLQAKSASL